MDYNQLLDSQHDQGGDVTGVSVQDLLAIKNHHTNGVKLDKVQESSGFKKYNTLLSYYLFLCIVPGFVQYRSIPEFCSILDTRYLRYQSNIHIEHSSQQKHSMQQKQCWLDTRILRHRSIYCWFDTRILRYQSRPDFYLILKIYFVSLIQYSRDLQRNTLSTQTNSTETHTNFHLQGNTVGM